MMMRTRRQVQRGLNQILQRIGSQRSRRIQGPHRLKSRRTNGLEMVDMVKNQVQMELGKMGGSMDVESWKKILELQTSTFQEIVTSSNKRKGDHRDPLPEQKVLINATVALRTTATTLLIGCSAIS